MLVAKGTLVKYIGSERIFLTIVEDKVRNSTILKNGDIGIITDDVYEEDHDSEFTAIFPQYRLDEVYVRSEDLQEI